MEQRQLEREPEHGEGKEPEFEPLSESIDDPPGLLPVLVTAIGIVLTVGLVALIPPLREAAGHAISDWADLQSAIAAQMRREGRRLRSSRRLHRLPAFRLFVPRGWSRLHACRLHRVFTAANRD